jgi:hypothetical protein
MSYSTCPVCKFAVEQYCSEKDAEIERLKNIIRATEVERDAADKICETLRAANASFEGGMHWRNGLITELCAALEQQSCWSTKMELIQRAREAINP